MPTIEERDRYARRAKKLRELRDSAHDPDIKQALGAMIDSYDRLLDEVDAIARLRVGIPRLDSHG